MRNKDEIKVVLNELVNLLTESIHWEQSAMLVAQKIGLQGEKRRNRYESNCNDALLKKIRCHAYDFLEIELIEGKIGKEMVASSFEVYFREWRSKLNTIYDNMHEIANKLVSLGMQPFAKCLYDKLACIEKDITYANRTIMEGNKCSWDAQFIFLHQTTAENIHDYYEKKEVH